MTRTSVILGFADKHADNGGTCSTAAAAHLATAHQLAAAGDTQGAERAALESLAFSVGTHHHDFKVARELYLDAAARQ